MNFLVIDAFNFTMTAFSVAMSNTENESEIKDTAFYILKSMINKLKNTFSDYKCYVVWDTFGGTFFRKEQYSDYKSNRDNSKFDFDSIRSCSSIYEKSECINVQIPECEADDAIYALYKVLKEKNNDSEIVIVSRDHDLIQVVQKGYVDKVWDNSSKKFLEIPDYSIVDYKSIVGDSSDNIKGVTGIGKVGALKVLNGERKLTLEESLEFEKCKNIIDISRNPKIDVYNQYMNEVIK